MYRFIATLIVSLTIAPCLYAQYGFMQYGTLRYGTQPAQSAPSGQTVPSLQQIENLPTPWVPSVPLVKPSDYARSSRTQYMLTYTLIYSGYYGPYFGQANTYAGSKPGNNGTNYYGNNGDSSSSTQNPYGQNSAKQNSYTPTNQPARPQPLATAAYPNHEPLLGGLADLKLNDVHVQRGDIVNARLWMRPKELATLIESVNEHAKVYHNAERLTDRLQAAGLLHAGDRVIGFADGKVYVLLAGIR